MVEFPHRPALWRGFGFRHFVTDKSWQEESKAWFWFIDDDDDAYQFLRWKAFEALLWHCPSLGKCIAARFLSFASSPSSKEYLMTDRKNTTRARTKTLALEADIKDIDQIFTNDVFVCESWLCLSSTNNESRTVSLNSCVSSPAFNRDEQQSLSPLVEPWKSPRRRIQLSSPN